MKVIGFGKFNRFYWLILFSALFKILINIFLKVEYQRYMINENISILESPILNDHIFVRFIYYYFGFIVLGFIYLISKRVKEKNNNKNQKIKKEEENYAHLQTINGRTASIELIYNDAYEELGHRVLSSILLIVIIYIISEMIYFYIDQRSMTCVNFWVLQIFFIHFILYRKEKLKLYSHQKLSFAIILLLSFGIYFVSSFLKQCDYLKQDPNKVVEEYINKTKILPPKIIENLTKIISDSIIKANEKGNRACSNRYNIFLLDNNFVYFIILAAFGYLIASFLKSYSVVKAKSLINKKFISIDIIIILMGILGLILNIILLFISSLIPCGKGDLPKNLCSSVKEVNAEEENIESKPFNIYYFDNFLHYIVSIRDDLFPKDEKEYRKRRPKDIIIEIIFSFLMSVFGFYKMRFDLSIIKELGVFHLLIPEVIYQFVINCYIIIYKIVNNIIDKTQITQFIFIIINELFALIGILIYMELIELKFCKLDKNIKRNISKRAIEDVEAIIELDEPFARDSLLDDNNENDNNNEKNNDDEKYNDNNNNITKY